MSIENPEGHIFTKEELKVKQAIQREILTRLCEDPNDEECMLKWIEEYGKDFSDAFNRRMEDDGFIDRCKNEMGAVIEELIKEVDGLHEKRAG